jgi:hypothetical protein
MPAAVREVPFAEAMIPIVSPEHLIVRKAMLDRSKDWVDVEAILVATDHSKSRRSGPDFCGWPVWATRASPSSTTYLPGLPPDD